MRQFAPFDGDEDARNDDELPAGVASLAGAGRQVVQKRRDLVAAGGWVGGAVVLR